MIVMSMNYIVPVTLLLLELPRPLEMVSAPHVVVQGVLINDKSLAIKKFQGLIEKKKIKITSSPSLLLPMLFVKARFMEKRPSC